MTAETKERVFLLFCDRCKRNHRMKMQPCVSCNGRGGWTPQPVSEHVYESCSEDYDCDGCAEYRSHMA